MTLKELTEKLKSLTDEGDALLAKDTLTEDEEARSVAILPEIESVRAKIKTAEAVEESRDWLNQPAEKDPPVVEIRDDAQVKAGDSRGAKKPYASLGEQLIDARKAELGNDGGARERLINVEVEARSISGMSETIPSDGGFLVQTDISSDMLTRAYGAAKLPSKCKQFPISNASNGVKLPYFDETSRATGSRFGGIQIYPASEGAGGTAKKPKIGMMELKLKKILGLAYITEELMMDASVMTAFYTQAFEEEFSYMFDDYIINGAGAGTPLGILNGDSLVSVVAEGGANTVMYEDIIQMQSQIYSACFGRGEWYINNNILPQLHSMALVVGAGGSKAYMPEAGLSVTPYGTLLGRPVNVLEQCPALGTVGDIIFADFSQYAWATKGSLDAAVSPHVRFLYGEDTIRWMVRIDGQPGWHSALTPANDRSTSETVSPFVALATRT